MLQYKWTYEFIVESFESITNMVVSSFTHNIFNASHQMVNQLKIEYGKKPKEKQRRFTLKGDDDITSNSKRNKTKIENAEQSECRPFRSMHDGGGGGGMLTRS